MRNVSLPPPPESVSLPEPPAMRLSLSSPVIESLPELPMTFSTLKTLAAVTRKLPLGLNVAKTPNVILRKIDIDAARHSVSGLSLESSVKSTPEKSIVSTSAPPSIEARRQVSAGEPE